MAKSYWIWSNDNTLVFERDGDRGDEPLRLLFHGDGGPRISADFTTAELQRVHAWLGWILERRIGKARAGGPYAPPPDETTVAPASEGPGLFD
jgi:hypothetical protein